MIAFGCATTNEREYRDYALPSIERVAERDSLVMRRHGYDSIHEPYNSMLAEAAERSDLEAVVLLHQDASIDDRWFVRKVRGLLATNPEIAIVGTMGAAGVPGLAWWEGDRHRGNVHSPIMIPDGFRVRHSVGAHEVDAVDGLLLVLSPWAARELQFDRGLAGPLDGYDVDICLQARARGRRVVVGDFEVAHYAHHDFLDRERWVRAAVALQRKWGHGLVPRHL